MVVFYLTSLFFLVGHELFCRAIFIVHAWRECILVGLCLFSWKLRLMNDNFMVQDRKLSPVLQFLCFFCILGLWWGSLTSTLRVTTLRKWLNHRYFWFFDNLFIHVFYATNSCIMLPLHSQVDQLVLEDVVRERFPKLGLYPTDITDTYVFLHSQYY